jgi:hypothetical protein
MAKRCSYSGLLTGWAQFISSPPFYSSSLPIYNPSLTRNDEDDSLGMREI